MNDELDDFFELFKEIMSKVGPEETYIEDDEDEYFGRKKVRSRNPRYREMAHILKILRVGGVINGR